MNDIKEKPGVKVALRVINNKWVSDNLVVIFCKLTTAMTAVYGHMRRGSPYADVWGGCEEVD
jgi:hypothetical protein